MLVGGAVVVLLLGLPSGTDAQDATETLFWTDVVCEKEGEVRAYLRVYPTGAYVNKAQACLEQGLGLDRAARILVQQGLAALDYEAGTADGLFGPATRAAVRQWQRGKGFTATGYLTRAQVDALMAAGRDALAAAEQQRQAEEQRRAAAERQRAEAAARVEAERQAREAAARAEAERQRQAEAERRRKAEEERRRAARPREWVNSLGMEFVRIEPGTFEMGSRSGEAGRDDDETQHRVTLSQAFYLGKYEVTQGQWAAVMGSNPSRFSNCGRTCPVEQVSWDDVQEFIRELNRREGANVYRLPTEAEWEYAARAGTQTALYTGGLMIRGRRNAPALDPVAWYGGNSGVSYAGGYDCSDWAEKQYASSRCGPHPVGQKQPNAWGLYDMQGNVWEWTVDWYGEYPRGAVIDPRGATSGAVRVNRGGSWDCTARGCRVALRYGDSPGGRHNSLGFRLARTL